MDKIDFKVRVVFTKQWKISGWKGQYESRRVAMYSVFSYVMVSHVHPPEALENKVYCTVSPRNWRQGTPSRAV